MKIGYVLTNMVLGGVQTQFADLIDHIIERHEVKYTVFSMKLADPFIVERYKNIQLVSKEELLEWADVIHMDGMLKPDEKIFFRPKWRRVIEHVGSARNFGLIDRLFKRTIPPYLIAQSRWIGNTLKVKHRVLYCPVDTDRFNSLPVEKKYDLVIIGRMRPIKNHKLFLEICRKGGFSFLTIGGTHRRLEGHVNAIEQMMRDNAVEGRDYVPGFVPNEDVVPLLNQARMAVVTSHSEGLGYNSLEPMACGVPVVARRVGGVPEAVGEDSDLLVPYDAPAEAYIEKINKYINDTNLRQKVKQRIMDHFSLKKAVEDYDRLYYEVYENR